MQLGLIMRGLFACDWGAFFFILRKRYFKIGHSCRYCFYKSAQILGFPVMKHQQTSHTEVLSQCVVGRQIKHGAAILVSPYNIMWQKLRQMFASWDFSQIMLVKKGIVLKTVRKGDDHLWQALPYLCLSNVFSRSHEQQIFVLDRYQVITSCLLLLNRITIISWLWFLCFGQLFSNIHAG